MKYKIFISSRNEDRLALDVDPGSKLTDIRFFLKQELEKQRLFDKEFLEVVINEDFKTDGTHDSYDECLVQIDNVHHTIALLSGSAGWAPAGIDLGICHAELSKAYEISPNQVTVIDISGFFAYTAPNSEQEKRDLAFKAYIDQKNRFRHPLKFSGAKTEDNFKIRLLAHIKDVILETIDRRIELATKSYIANGGGEIVLEWKGMSYESRNREIIRLMKAIVEVDYLDTVTVIKAIPDNTSTPEALNFCGRSFLSDQVTIKEAGYEKLEKGPIHFVGIFGTVTEGQVRKLLGNPDIVTIKAAFGVYVWERTQNIQMVFLAKCSTPEATKINYIHFKNWVATNGLADNIDRRSKARHIILKAYNDAQAML